MIFLRQLLHKIRIFAEDAIRSLYTPLKSPGKTTSRPFVTQKTPH